MLDYIFYAMFGFFSGSILYSHIIAKKFCNVDITAVSDDGNPGASNVFKYGDIRYGIPALLLDIMKGVLPVFIAAKNLEIAHVLFLLVLISPVLGHAFSPFLKGHGGKAIAVSFGCLLGLIPNYYTVLALAACLIFFTFIIVIKPDSLRCILAYSLFILYSIQFAPISSLKYGCVIIAGVIIFKHLKSLDLDEAEFHVILLDRWLHRS